MNVTNLLGLALYHRGYFSTERGRINCLCELVRRTAPVIPRIGRRQDRPPLLRIRGDLLRLLKEVPQRNTRVSVACVVVRRHVVECRQRLSKATRGIRVRQFLYAKALRFRLRTNARLSTGRLTSFLIILSNGIFSIGFRRGVSNFRTCVNDERVLM